MQNLKVSGLKRLPIIMGQSYGNLIINGFQAGVITGRDMVRAAIVVNDGDLFVDECEILWAQCWISNLSSHFYGEAFITYENTRHGGARCTQTVEISPTSLSEIMNHIIETRLHPPTLLETLAAQLQPGDIKA